MISSSSSSSPSSSSSGKPPPPQQATKWRSGTQHKIYGRRLLDALRATGGGQPRAVKAAADSALALTARGQTRWSRAILLAGAACSRRRVLVKAGGKIRRRHRRPQQAKSDSPLVREGGKVQERLRVLGRLVPGCRKLPAPDLLEEAADYVAALQMQVNTMRALADALAAAQLSDPDSDAGAGAEAERNCHCYHLAPRTAAELAQVVDAGLGWQQKGGPNRKKREAHPSQFVRIHPIHQGGTMADPPLQHQHLWWLGRMASAFGSSFLCLVCLIYFIQGFRSFVWTAVSYQIKDVMKLSPSTSQFLVSIAYFPWSIKPIYGILSDCIPIKQRKRVPYLIISSCLSLLPWLILGLSQTLRASANMLTALLVVQNLGSAMADVVIDAMVAEAVRAAGPEFAGDLQSLSWSSMAVGGIFGSLLGGYALSNLPIHAIYVVFSALPFFQLVSCMFVEDSPKRFQCAMDEHKYVNNQSAVTAISEKGSSQALGYEGTRRRKGTRKSNKRRPLSKRTEANEKNNRSISSSPCLSLRSAFFSLCTAFKQPTILQPMTWFFFSNVTIPNISTVMFYYQTEELHLEASFLGTAHVIGWFGLILGTYTYNRYFKHKKLRNILVFSHVGLAIISLLDIVLVSRLHVTYGIADKYMVLWGSALAYAINQFKMMPFLILSGQLCPPGIEGTLFALFMSINNLGSTLGSFLGAALALALNISTAQFDNLALGLGVQLIGTLLPIVFLFLIPKEVTGLTS